MSDKTDTPFPNTTQELLLQAALLHGNSMRSAFDEWKKKVHFEEDIRYASFRLLPLLYNNLYKQQVQDELMPRLKGIYRQSWSKNHLLFHETANVIRLLTENAIPTILMKGMALTILNYKNYSTRPMADMDILVHLKHAHKTIDILKQHGWKLQEEEYLDFNLKYGRSTTFLNENKTELDLHWHPIFEAHDNITEDDFWDASVPLEVSGVWTRAFCVTDNFFHAIVHGLRYNPEPPIRWVADAITILNNDNGEMSWSRLMHHTKKFRVTLQMKSALTYLIENFELKIPSDFWTELSQTKASYSDRLVFEHAKTFGDRIPKTPYEKAHSVYAAYLRQTNKKSWLSKHLGLIKYLHFRTKDKPRLKITMYYLSLLLKQRK